MNGDLTEFSEKVKMEFIKTFPSLMKLNHKIVENDESAFCLEITPPSSNTKHPFSIDTFGEEVTVAFDAYHAHFNDFMSNSEHETAVDFINQIIGGEYAVVSYWRDDKCCGSRLLSKVNFPTDNDEYPYANNIRVRSWSGALDMDIKCEPRG